MVENYAMPVQNTPTQFCFTCASGPFRLFLCGQSNYGSKPVRYNEHLYVLIWKSPAAYIYTNVKEVPYRDNMKEDVSTLLNNP